MKNSFLFIALLLSLFTLLNGYVFHVAHEAQKSALLNQFNAAAGGFANLVNANLKENRLALRRMANRWDALGGTPEHLWRIDAKAYAEDLTGAFGVGYANAKSEIQWLEPTEPNRAALNFRLSSEERRRRTLENARLTRSTQMTDPIQLVQGGKGFLMLCPVYRGEKLDGYVYLATRFQEYFSKILHTDDYCLEIDFENEKLFQNCPDGHPGVSQEFQIVQRGLVTEAPKWELHLEPKPAYLKELSGTYLLQIMTISLLVTGLLVLLLQAIVSNRKKSKLIRSQMHDLKIARQKAEESARVKEDFLATVSHEIRTPLNGIIGISNLLKDTPLNERQMEFVKHLLDSGSLLLALINDVLDITKIEAGRLELEDVNFNLEQAIDHIISSFSYQAKNKNLSIEADFAQPIPHWVRGDVARLKQVLINLVGNALKFSQRGTITIRTEILNVTEQMITVCIHVIDQGVGIPVEVRSKIFEKFIQASKDVHRQFGGTGLGLSISKRIVEKMGGAIGVESNVGSGSDFFFTIAFPIGREELLPSGDVAPTPVSRRKLRVLVAEDNSVNQLVAMAILKKYGHDCQAVGNGLEVMSILRKVDFDVILMDCNMPEMDGFKTAGEIRKLQDPLKSRIPIIAMTANAMLEDRERCLRAGMDDYITKPIIVERLLEILNSISTDAAG